MALTADGFDGALLGFLTCPDGVERAVYSKEKMVEILAADMSEDEAEEYLAFNTWGAYVGPATPLYVDWHWSYDLFHANEHGA
jgi:hypothetical protein